MKLSVVTFKREIKICKHYNKNNKVTIRLDNTININNTL